MKPASLQPPKQPTPSPRSSGATTSSSRREARPESGTVQSVERAIALLESLAEAGRGTSLTELAARSQLNISTCHHLLATMLRRGYVAKIPGRRTYALGARVLHLGQAFLRQVDLPRRAQPALERLNQSTGEAVHLAVLQGDSVVTVAKQDARHPVRVETGAIGACEAPHATATGKAMLAWLPEDQIMRVLTAYGLQRFTPKTVTDFDQLLNEFRHVRRNGYAIDREEYVPGVVCVGAAVRDYSGAVIGAVSASAPTFRADEAHLTAMRNAVVAVARDVSSDFGAPPLKPLPEKPATAEASARSGTMQAAGQSD